MSHNKSSCLSFPEVAQSAILTSTRSIYFPSEANEALWPPGSWNPCCKLGCRIKICLLVSLSQTGRDKICEISVFVIIKTPNGCYVSWRDRFFSWKYQCVSVYWWNISRRVFLFRRVIMRSVNFASFTSPAGLTTAFPATPPDCWASFDRSSSSTHRMPAP